MIYLITGTPGSGKSLYAVSTLVRKLLAQKPKDASGNEVDRRLVVDGVSGLLLPHEDMAPGNFRDQLAEPGEGHGVWNWWEWCKPGDVIFIDEVQRWWRPRGMGSKVPDQIKHLETHRHYGVDFVLVTQNPMLLDQNVRRLTGHHTHVRRVFGGARAILYEWDSGQADVSRVKTATKTLFSYPKDAFKLYKSSELHTKQRHRLPWWVVVPVAGLLLGVAVAPKAYEVLHGAATGKGISGSTIASAPSPVPSSPTSFSAPGQSAAPVPLAPASKPGDDIAGCVASADRCSCVDVAGKILHVTDEVCEAHVGGLAGDLPPAKTNSLREYLPPVPNPNDREAVAWYLANNVGPKPAISAATR